MSGAPTPCLTADCYNYATTKGRCAEHQKKWNGQQRTERLPSDWSQRRAMVFARDGHFCYVCKGDGADAIDHLIANDNNDLSNLAPIHHNVYPYCHREKSALEGNEARWGRTYIKRTGSAPF